jgi:hypothetical protein
VRPLMNMRAPISGLDRPSRAIRAIRASCAVSCSSPVVTVLRIAHDKLEAMGMDAFAEAG